ncbi:hypothetical protein ILYODFUR_019253 [Ilyodon furcidens]|uniref:NADH dehydrogenase subunit 6 n=1 Tax=Ilyodon furcidens TaxID=33524 RepID=A0ABV0SYJ0_9TELE
MGREKVSSCNNINLHFCFFLYIYKGSLPFVDFGVGFLPCVLGFGCCGSSFHGGAFFLGGWWGRICTVWALCMAFALGALCSVLSSAVWHAVVLGWWSCVRPPWLPNVVEMRLASLGSEVASGFLALYGGGVCLSAGWFLVGGVLCAWGWWSSPCPYQCMEGCVVLLWPGLAWLFPLGTVVGGVVVITNIRIY